MTSNTADNRHSRNTYIMYKRIIPKYIRAPFKTYKVHTINNIALASEDIFEHDAS